jgi:hypothetical protein
MSGFRGKKNGKQVSFPKTEATTMGAKESETPGTITATTPVPESTPPAAAKGRNRGRKATGGRSQTPAIQKQAAPPVRSHPPVANVTDVTSNRFPYAFTSLRERYMVPYFLDFHFFALLCSDVWGVMVSVKDSSRLPYAFCEAQFVEACMRVAFAALIEAHASTGEPIPDPFTNPPVIAWLRTYHNTVVPKFVSEFISCLGLFSSPNGTQFYTAVPEYGNFTAGATTMISSFPNFLALRRRSFNSIQGYDTDNIGADFTENDGPGNPPTVLHADVLPGLHPIGNANRYCQDAWKGRVPIVPWAMEESAFGAMQIDSIYDSALSIMFERMQAEGQPMVAYPIITTPKKAVPAAMYTVRFRGISETASFPNARILTTSLPESIPREGCLGRLFGLSLIKPRNWLVDAAEGENRYDPEILAITASSAEYQGAKNAIDYVNKAFISR